MTDFNPEMFFVDESEDYDEDACDDYESEDDDDVPRRSIHERIADLFDVSGLYLSMSYSGDSFVAQTDDGEIVAAISYFILPSSGMIEFSIAVLPKYRRLGVARRLLQRFMDLVPDHIESLTPYSVRGFSAYAVNQTAIPPLLTSLGFTALTQTVFEYILEDNGEKGGLDRRSNPRFSRWQDTAGYLDTTWRPQRYAVVSMQPSVFLGLAYPSIRFDHDELKDNPKDIYVSKIDRHLLTPADTSYDHISHYGVSELYKDSSGNVTEAMLSTTDKDFPKDIVVSASYLLGKINPFILDRVTRDKTIARPILWVSLALIPEKVANLTPEKKDLLCDRLERSLESGALVVGHEGRNRALAILLKEGDSPIEVEICLSNSFGSRIDPEEQIYSYNEALHEDIFKAVGKGGMTRQTVYYRDWHPRNKPRAPDFVFGPIFSLLNIRSSEMDALDSGELLARRAKERGKHG
jgi:GNAT superfamily N-acetyltransferase